jgi:outer membrane protein insertion porin family
MKLILMTILLVIIAGYSQDNYYLDTVVIQGAKSVEDPARLFDIKAKDSVSMAGIEAAFLAFQKAYEKEAVITCGFLLKKEIDTTERKLVLALVVSENEWVKQVMFDGNTLIPSDSLMAVISHQFGGPFLADSLQADMERLKRYYRERRMSVQVSTRLVGGREKRITFYLAEEVQGITLHFKGNRFYSQEKLKAHFSAQRTHRTGQATLAANLAHLEKLYHQNGFFNCRIDFNIKDDTCSIFIHEGRRRKISSLNFIGNKKIKTDTLLYFSEFKRREYFSQARINTLIEKLLQYYENHGYPFCEITLDRIQADSAMVAVFLQIKEKGKYKFGKLFIHGSRGTRQSVIKRISKLNPGDLFSQESLLKSRQRLIRSGLFDRVEPLQLTLRENRRITDVHIHVTEGPQNSAEGIIGYAPEAGGGRFSGFINIMLGNIAGTYRKLSLQYAREHPLTNGDFRYQEPWLLQSNVDGEVFLHFRMDETYYTLLETGGRFNFPLQENLKVYFGLSRTSHSYRVAEESDSSVTDRTTATHAGGVLDLRDFPENPRGGIYVDVPVYYGIKQGYRESYNEVKPGVRTEAIYNVTGPHVVFLSLNYRTLVTKDTSLTRGELFPLGGTATLRGYRENQFYGQTVGFAQVEYRFLTGLRSRLIAFLDVGAFDESHTLKNVRQRRDVLYGYGVGLMLKTRAGIVGVDYGMGKGDSFLEGKIHFRLKNNF